MIFGYRGPFLVKFSVFHSPAIPHTLLLGMDRTRNQMADRILRSKFQPDAEIPGYGVTVKEFIHQLRHGGEQAEGFLEGMANMAAARLRLILPKDAVNPNAPENIKAALVKKKRKKSKNMELF